MRARQQPPSMIELCNIYRKRKELIWKSNQPSSEIDETPLTFSDPFTAPSAASERENTTETIDTRRKLPLCLKSIRPCVIAKESQISYLSAEKKSNLRHSEKTDDQRFSPVETPMESFKTDAVKSSSDEECSFHDDSTQPRLFQKHQIYRMRATVSDPFLAESHTMTSPLRDEKNMSEEETQANPPNHSEYQSSYSSKQAGNTLSPPQPFWRRLPNTELQGVNSLHQVQGSDETCSSRQTIISSLNLQKNTQWEGTGPSVRQNACSDTAVTTLPPLQQRTRKTADRLRQSRVTAEQYSHVLSHENFTSRRKGMCKETDGTQKQRTFLRVLGKRF